MPEDKRAELYESVLPDLAELCRNHDVSLELIRRSHDLDELLDGVLAEYESRLATVSLESTERDGRSVRDADDKKLRALVMFAGQAAALKEKAVAATELRRRADELERTNARLREALTREERTRRRLDDVLAALDAGILIAGSDGTIENANRAMHERHQMEKLAEVMKTLSVLSHKINNPLTALMGRAQILRMDAGTEPKVLKAAEVIEEASRRIATYIRELALVVKEGRTEALRQVLDDDSAQPELGGEKR